MKLARSVVVALDGESKCGKTTVIKDIAAEATHQANFIPRMLDPENGEWRTLSGEYRSRLIAVHEQLVFDNITTISAGNAFRAAALFVILEERKRREKTSFTPDDTDKIRELLRTEGIEDVLQHDPEVGRRVTPIAKMMGVQALCGTIFCDTLQEAYSTGKGSSLVIVDARDPIGHMQRNNLLGKYPPHIDPSRVLPVYIDTPVKYAAERMDGNYEDNLALITSRRHEDATRIELPVARPRRLIDNFDEWAGQFATQREAFAVPLRFYNGEGVDLDDIQYFAGNIAAAAQSIACFDYDRAATQAAA